MTDEVVQTLAQLRAEITGLRLELLASRSEVQTVIAALQVLLARVVDPTHITVAEASRVLGICQKTVRRRYAKHLKSYNGMPKKNHSIPIEVVFGNWLPLKVALATIERMRREEASDAGHRQSTMKGDARQARKGRS